ncbi:tannase/feruloyl esterase family alpha/beta hydrolase [Halotalea alkalilenta]|uniref:tannase/feruloyl esterase family alpha/beta hydrolase n=1 Tax=Halotalea alkalilenta TaxID=376489 RepID=UPI0009DC9757|nr:tannase/feruloyl esterase family alpha/beta hydrolase [Halotalea alkalilenta]
MQRLLATKAHALGAGLLLLAAPVLANPASDAPDDAGFEQRCAALAAQAGPTLVIDDARYLAAGELPQASASSAALTGAALSKAAMPAQCLVTGTLQPRQGVGGDYGIGFELRMPLEWNGNFLYQGGGGLNGIVSQAIGAVPVSGSTSLPALSRGFAVISTDSGHQGESNADASFGVDQQARLDFGYAAIGKVHDLALELIDAFYAKAPSHSYFMGCSNGGREAMMAAQRFPLNFDGIVAGNPGFRMSHAAIGEAWSTRQLSQIAPRDGDGQPILSAALTSKDMSLIGDKVLAQCDAADGLEDGQIDAMKACSFDPATLACPAEKHDGCLSQAQVGALKEVFDGAHDSSGGQLYASWPWDAGLAGDNWRSWVLGTSTTAEPDALNAVIGTSSLAHYFITPPQPDLKLSSLDFDTIAEQVAQTAAINDATSTQYASFEHRGGKLLVFHGNSDPVFSANDLRSYWDGLVQDNGGRDPVAEWARLFIVPGMTHCGGGPALDDFDPLAAIQAWVEQDQAPAHLIAQGASFPGRSRPICPYPEEARFTGTGDPQDAANFACRLPD